jgi:hypothetical protein
MGDSPFFSVPIPGATGPQLFAAPSASDPNSVAPMPETLLPLVAYANKLGAAIMAVKSLVEDVVPHVSRDLTGALAAIRALVGAADAMDETLQFRPQLLGSIVAKCHAFRDKSHALLKAALDKAGPEMNPRALIPDLDRRVREATGELVNLLRDPANISAVRTFAEDSSVREQIRFAEIWYLGTLQSFAVDVLARTDRSDEIDRMAQEVLNQHDESGSVPAITVKEGRALWEAFVAATATVTGMAGNLPAPDSLSIALLKCYAAYRLPSAALSHASASNLEGELFSMIVDAVKLTDPQKQELRSRMDQLGSAQREVILAAKAESDTAQRLPGHEARIARKTRQREQAEETCRGKAEVAREFYKDAYGKRNEEIFGEFQRGPFMDSFVSVLAIIQFCAAFQELDDPRFSSLQKFADITASGLISLGAVVSTVGRLLPIDIGIAKFNLGVLGKLAESMATKIAVYAGAMAVVSGAAQVYSGWVDHDPETVIVGGMTIASGTAIMIGAIWGIAAATGVGVGIGVLLAGYMGFKALADALKSDTEKAIDSILESLEKKTIYGDRTVVSYLGVEAQLKAVRDALDGWDCFLLLPNPHGSPTREDLIHRMRNLGFDEKLAPAMVEDRTAESTYPVLMLTP